MPFDPTVAIVFGTLLAALLASFLYAAWYQQFKHRHKAPRPGMPELPGTIGIRELEGLIRKAVGEATRPLDDRLATLEAEVQALGAALGDESRMALPGREAPPLLDLPGEVGGEAARAEPRRRVR